MSRNYRLILSSKNSAKTNMQIDKVLLDCFSVDDDPIFRIYQWTPSFSVGASQKCEDFPLFIKKYSNNCAKRLTGGGVLFHGFDMSYAFIAPNFMFEGFSIKQSYERICQFLLDFYKSLNLTPSFAKDLPMTLAKSDFCQIGYEAYDIMMDGKKIGGNAQKRVKNKIFQHGSIPIFDTIDKTNEGYSLKDLGVDLDFQNAQNLLLNSFTKCFDANFIYSDLSKIEQEKLEKLQKDCP